MGKKIVISCVSNDLETDYRVHKTLLSLQKTGFHVILAGRKLKTSSAISREYPTKRLRLIFNRGLFFYACLNLRLFLYLVFHKADIIISNDLDTLPACFLASKFGKRALVYDSHELFTEAPELQSRKFVKNVWCRIEKWIFPKLRYVITVSESIASHYEKLYEVPVHCIRNLPIKKTPTNSEAQYMSSLPERFILYQGALNTDRGIEKMIAAIPFLSEMHLVIAGDGDKFESLKKMAAHSEAAKRIHFTGRIGFEQLKDITHKALLGLSLEQAKGLNYYYALPNKLFSYIHAETPVICSDFPEMQQIVNTYDVGSVIEPDISPDRLAEHIQNCLEDQKRYQQWKENCKKAANELNWENEEAKLLELFRPFTSNLQI